MKKSCRVKSEVALYSTKHNHPRLFREGNIASSSPSFIVVVTDDTAQGDVTNNIISVGDCCWWLGGELRLIGGKREKDKQTSESRRDYRYPWPTGCPSFVGGGLKLFAGKGNPWAAP